MAMPRIDRRLIDRNIQRMSRCGIAVKRQARELGISESIVYERRRALGLSRKSPRLEQSAHA